MDELTGRVVIVPDADTETGAAVARVMCEAGASAFRRRENLTGASETR